MTHVFKYPAATYRPRLKRFLMNLRQVRKIPPHDVHLWKVMDTPAFEDTETALETVLKNTQTRRKVS